MVSGLFFTKSDLIIYRIFIRYGVLCNHSVTTFFLPEYDPLHALVLSAISCQCLYLYDTLLHVCVRRYGLTNLTCVGCSLSNFDVFQCV